jgi:V8-like Glu-specific endopeptidase
MGANRQLLILVFALATTWSAWANQTAMISPQDPAGALQVLKGHPARPASWPMTRLFIAGKWGCTGTAIGERAILTAAHCLVDGPEATFEDHGRAIAVTCTPYPNWKDAWPEPVTSYDIALCRAAENIKMSDSERYERISLAKGLLKHGQSVTLLGYGCTETAPSLAYLYVGTGIIAEPDFGAYVKTTLGTGAQVCPGDSGGAVYAVEDANRRQIAAIASRGDQNQSWLTRLADPNVSQFIKKWAVGTAVCGINASDEQCHD